MQKQHERLGLAHNILKITKISINLTKKLHVNNSVLKNLNSLCCMAYTFSRTIPLACEAPAKGLAFHLVPK